MTGTCYTRRCLSNEPGSVLQSLTQMVRLSLTKAASLVILLGVATMVAAAAAGPISSVTQAEGGRPDPPEDPSGKPVDAGEVVQQFLIEKFREARDLFERQQYYPAFRLADAILVIDPDVPFRAELRRLRRRAEARYSFTRFWWYGWKH